MDKHSRVQLILAECGRAEPYGSHDGAYEGVNDIINKVEDEHSPDPFDPSGRSRDRIYGPSRGFASPTEYDDLIEYGHVNHITLIYKNGAFMILDRKGKILLDKPGADGGFCPR
jgi:hypothetical protein